MSQFLLNFQAPASSILYANDEDDQLNDASRRELAHLLFEKG